MKKLFALLLVCLSSVGSFAQSIDYFYPAEARRGTEVRLHLEGLNTHFSQSSSFVIIMKSRVDGSEIQIMDVYPGSDSYCYGYFMVPATAIPGGYDVSIVTSNHGILTKANAFSITNIPPVPILVRVSPDQLNKGDDVEVIVQARYTKFLDTPQIGIYLKGTYNHIQSGAIDVINDTALTVSFHIPQNAKSDWCEVIVKMGVDSLVLPYRFRINGLNASILSFSPNSVSSGSEAYIYINANQTKFTTATNISVYAVGEASAVAVLNDTTLLAKFDIPQKTVSGVSNLVVVVDEEQLHAYGGLTINGISPTVYQISVDTGAQGETMDVIIKGTDMYFTSAPTINVGFSGDGGYFFADTAIVVNDNQIKATIHIPNHIPPGLYSVHVSANYLYGMLYNGFTVVDDGMPDPSLLSVSPNTAARGQILDLIVSGQGTAFTQASGFRVWLMGDGYLEATTTTIINDSQLRCSFLIPVSASTGLYAVTVTSNNSDISLTNCFTVTGVGVLKPALVSISPSIIKVGQKLDMKITGVNTHFMATGVKLRVYYAPLQMVGYTATSDTTVVAQVEVPDDMIPGLYDFIVYSPLDEYLGLIQSVIVEASDPVGLEENNKLIGKLYPNPVHNKLYIETQQQINTLTIIDLTGKQTVIDPNEIKQDPTHLVIPIDKLGLRSGIYFIRLESDSGFDYQKFIVE